jgi:hypothetical protein
LRGERRMMSRPRERKNKKAAAGLHEKLQVLRSITHSRAVNPLAVHLRYCFSSPFFSCVILLRYIYSFAASSIYVWSYWVAVVRHQLQASFGLKSSAGVQAYTVVTELEEGAGLDT